MKPSKSKSSAKSSVNQAPRYDLSVNPPYQINYRAKRAGKHISASKRRITFQFGFSSASAVAAGRTEAECRGEEHEIVLVWSHLTGKRQLFMDGREIHMSKAARGNTKFTYSWSIPGNHVCKIIANGTPSNSSEKAMGIKQFDLELDGMSYFEFSRIYELGSGTSGNGASKKVDYSYRGMGYDARDDNEEEEENQSPPPMNEVKLSVDLFDSQPSVLSPASSNYNSVPSLMGCSLSSTSSSSFDDFMPVEARKTFDSISNNILNAYSTGAPAAPSATSQQQSSSRALVPVSEEGMDAITKSMRNLVNLDDITTQPLAPITANSLSLSNMKKSGAHQANNWGLLGREPTLAEMRDSSATNSPGAPTQRDVMTPAPQMMYQQQQPQAPMMAQQGGYQQYGAAPQYGAPQYGAPNMNNMGYAAY